MSTHDEDPSPEFTDAYRAAHKEKRDKIPVFVVMANDMAVGVAYDKEGWMGIIAELKRQFPTPQFIYIRVYRYMPGKYSSGPDYEHSEVWGGVQPGHSI